MHKTTVRRHEHDNLPFAHSRITPMIWVGTNQCCTTHFSHALRRLGITADISLESERLDAAYGVQCFLWLPVRDHNAPTQMQLRVGMRALVALVAAKVRVYVHCKNGHGRAPTLVAAYLIASEGLTVTAAVDRLRAKRPNIHLMPAQLRALEQFAQWSSRSGSRIVARTH